jgi:sec-independent protein translocase protein TatB
MFDIGWQELFIVTVLALIVIGPKDLPRAVRAMGKWVRKARTLARDFQGGLDDVMREAELDDLKKEMDSASALDIAGEIENTIDPTGEYSRGLDMGDIETDLDSAAGTSSDATTPAQAEPEKPPPGKAPTGKAAPRKAASGKAAPRKAAPRKAAPAAKAPAASVEAPDPEDEVITPAKASG